MSTNNQSNKEEINEEDRQYNALALTTTELKTLLKVLAPSGQDEEDVNHELYAKLWQHANYGHGMWFVNVYEESTRYGGPEEGGWHYTHRELLYALGNTQLEPMVEEFINIIDDCMTHEQKLAGHLPEASEVTAALYDVDEYTWTGIRDEYDCRPYVTLTCQIADEEHLDKPYFE